MIAIIGGTGVGDFLLEGGAPEETVVTTPWGAARVRVGALGGKPVAFLPRHGPGHRLPPHRIPHRAHIAALALLGARAVLATAAVGGLRPDLRPGDLVLLDDFIDFTGGEWGRTFFDAPGQVVHTDFTAPYSPELRAAALAAARDLRLPLRPRGTYLCADGPRYETPAEVRLFAAWGADVVGMTGVPEAVLAREAGLHYAGVALVTNFGVGLFPEPVRHEEVEAVMRAGGETLRALLAQTIARIDAAELPPIGPGAPLPGLSDVRLA